MRAKSNSFVRSYYLLRLNEIQFATEKLCIRVIAKRRLERNSKLDRFREEKGIFILCKSCNPI